MSMAASKRDKTDVRDLIDMFIRRWQPAFMEGADNFLVELERLLAEARRQCLENSKRCQCQIEDSREHDKELIVEADYES